MEGKENTEETRAIPVAQAEGVERLKGGGQIGQQGEAQGLYSPRRQRRCPEQGIPQLTGEQAAYKATDEQHDG